jgi:hypothetical protein
VKILKCKLCDGEVDIIANHRSVSKKIKCRKCKFTNLNDKPSEPEVVIIRKKKK